MQRRDVLSAAVAAGTPLVTGCIAGITPEWVPARGTDTAAVLTVALAATGPATGAATVSVRHRQTPRCRYRTPACGTPATVDRLHEATATVYAGDRRTWQVPIETTAAVDTYVIAATTDADTRRVTVRDREDRSIRDGAPADLTVPPTDTDTVTADLTGPLTLSVDVATQS